MKCITYLSNIITKYILKILGLDPAFPLYMFGGDTGRLSYNDAKFVDVIHTDGGVFGYPWALGHADFFPNGGTPLQPGCVQEETSKNRWLGIICKYCLYIKDARSKIM